MIRRRRILDSDVRQERHLYSLRIYAPLWSIPILAIGLTETAAPYAEVETAGESEASKSSNRIPIPRYSEAVTVNLIARLPQPVSRSEGASKKMASLILDDPISAGATKNVSTEISEKLGGAHPSNTGTIPVIVKNNSEDLAGPKSTSSPAILDDLVARSTPIAGLVEHNDVLDTTFSKPDFAVRQLASNGMRPMDQQRMIYGTSARNADKAYFPQQFGQLAETLQEKSEAKLTSSIPVHGELQEIEGNFLFQASDQANPVALSIDNNRSGTTFEMEELSKKDGYFHYGSSDVDSDIAFLTEEDSFGKLSKPDASAGSPVIPSEVSSVPVLLDKPVEIGSAS